MTHTPTSDKSKSSRNQKKSKSIGSQMDECIEHCLDTSRSCNELIAHCLAMGGAHSSEEHISLLTTCASICQTSATFMIYNSDYHRESCRLCAKVCITCAEDCERIAEDESGTDGEQDAEMLDCALLCRRAAESCERMSAN